MTADPQTRQTEALERIASALEFLAGAYDERRVQPADALAPDQLAPLPYAAQQPPQTNAPSNWTCPVHHQVKTVPAGVSRRTQKPYDAFLACPVQDCPQKPPR